MPESKLAQGYLTASKHRSQWLESQPHRAVTSGGGNLVTERGSYLDFFCACGANLIGYQNSYSLPTSLEEELADRICRLFPFVDKIKIVKTGSDACNCAMRIAAAYKGKYANKDESYPLKAIGTGYHGNGNLFIQSENPGRGCYYGDYYKYDNTNELLNCLENDNSVDICIVEPVELDQYIKPKLRKLREVCTEKKVVLVFDEIITGFRVPQYSFSNYFGIHPDIICLGKALGNGYPIAIVGGKRSIMETPEYFFSGTYFGEVESIRESIKTLDFLSIERLEEFWQRGNCFQRKLNMLSPDVQLIGYPTRGVWEGKNKYLFWQGMSDRGYLLGKAFFLNFSHTPEMLNRFIEDAREVIALIDAGQISLIGEEPQPIFKR